MPRPKVALIFGHKGQAGYYLQKFLLAKGYATILGDNILDTQRAAAIVNNYEPDEIYNLAALMYAPDSWKRPVEYLAVNGAAVGGLLDVVLQYCPKARFFQAGSAEVFGSHAPVPQNEKTPRCPDNPYGIAKFMAEELVRVYRQKGLHASTGILFNMESMRRPKTFFVQKVIDAAVSKKHIELGPLGAIRDWGLTEEYVEAMWLMLQQHSPDDYVIGTGVSSSCYSFVCEAFSQVGLNWRDYVSLNHSETNSTIMEADPTKIERKLGWRAQTRFGAVITHLLQEEIKLQETTVG